MIATPANPGVRHSGSSVANLVVAFSHAEAEALIHIEHGPEKRSWHTQRTVPF